MLVSVKYDRVSDGLEHVTSALQTWGPWTVI